MTPEYRAWQGMIYRCENPKFKQWADYGGRGIKVCARWRASFRAFLEDMGPRAPGASLDRFPNNDGDYEPGNCRWATATEQGRNKRDNRILTVGSTTLTLSAWAEQLGLTSAAILGRLKAGWTVEEALTAPRTPTHAPRRERIRQLEIQALARANERMPDRDDPFVPDLSPRSSVG